MTAGAAGIGAPAVRPDAEEKAWGRFDYAGARAVPGELFGVTVRSPLASARLDGMDVAAAMAVPGARRVVTAADVPGARQVGLKVADQPVLALDRVRYAGEPVAFVVAASQESARLMAAALRPVLVATPALLDPERALDPDAPLVGPAGNLVSALRLTRGSGARGPVGVRATWRTGRQDAAFLAPEAGVAVPHPDGTVELRVATQDVHEDRRQVAAVLGWAPERVLVRLAGVGGAFGGREDLTLQAHLALAAVLTGAPVRAVYSRGESFLAHPSRHPSRLTYELTAGRDGVFVSLVADLLLDGGAYASTSMPITKILHYFAAGAYRFPSLDVGTRSVYTNNPVAGALRGFGATQACFGIESTVDLMAAELGMDPVDLRRRNLIRAGGPVATSGQRLVGTADPVAVLEACVGVALPGRPPAGRPAHLRRGVGYAVGFKSAGLGDGRADPASLHLVLDEDGVVIHSAAPEVGQGIVAVLTRVVSQVLPGIRVRLAPADTTMAVAGASKASRQTMASGGAAYAAALDLLGRLQELAAQGGHDEWSSVPLQELLAGRVLRADARNDGPSTVEADAAGRGDVTKAFQLTAHRAVVDVDVELGTARLVQLVAAQDVGRAVDPAGAHGQLAGGTVQGAGFALLEEILLDGDGTPTTTGFGDYLLPLADDVPDVVTVLVEHPDERLAFGAKGLGEGPLVSSPAAVAAALRAATGRVVPGIPVHGEELVADHGTDAVTAQPCVAQ
jgi:CO/xanthine dehydrogenase Mo-binding subunit